MVSEARSRNMSKIRHRDTKVELRLRKALWKRGLRYRKNFSQVYGRPDVVLTKAKIAIFCDSEYWHGKKFLAGEIPKTNTDFWVNKFETNISRDKDVNKVLWESGWIVLRFWEKDIYKKLDAIVSLIEKVNTLRTTDKLL
jgi:DNA mismatch endonuclease, patch repair protein